MQNTPEVIAKIVKNDLCVGCGICTSTCPDKALSMNWNDSGFLTPILTGACDGNGECIEVCPFNTAPTNSVQDETTIANAIFPESKNIDPKIGRYIGTYAGYSKKHRAHSSSGGIATYILEKLLFHQDVDHVIGVAESTTPDNHFEYTISSSINDLRKTAKTKYYPVSFKRLFEKIETTDGKFAVVGVPCFIKAVRLAQAKNPLLKKRIVFTVGIICGGIKSKFYTEYMVDKAGGNIDDYSKPSYRVKNPKGNAGDYSFRFITSADNTEHQIRRRSMGDMWGTGLFKANACDYCDDVAAELADISLGDAWISPYIAEGMGNNVIITRSAIAEKYITAGIDSSDLVVNKIDKNDFIKSQKGSYYHRQDALPFRLKKLNVNLRKRHNKGTISFSFRWVQNIRRKTRLLSLELWKENRNAENFDRDMASVLNKLKWATQIYHYQRGAYNRIKRFLK